MSMQPEQLTIEDPDPRAEFAEYVHQGKEESASNLVGYLVLFALRDSRLNNITVDQLTRWFRMHGLDEHYLPKRIRPMDVFERVLENAEVTYRLDELGKDGPPRELVPGEPRREATLNIRPVYRERGVLIERHLVRELRDETTRSLAYEVRLAKFGFEYDRTAGNYGQGTLQVSEDDREIAKLDPLEQAEVRAFVANTCRQYEHACQYVDPNRLRTLLRSFVGGIEHSVRILPTAGVFFVYYPHRETLEKLADVVSHFGPQCMLSLLPLQRKDGAVVVNAVATQTSGRLAKLAADLVAEGKKDKPSESALMDLRKRYLDLAAEAKTHADLWSTSLDETEAALTAVRRKFRQLLGE